MPVVLSDRNYRELVSVIKKDRQRLTNLERRTAGALKRYGYARTGTHGLRFYNDSGETVPAFGVMRVTGAGSSYLTIAKPNTTFQGLYLVNGSRPIIAQRFGRGKYLTADENGRRRFAIYNPANAPAVGESWGVIANSWWLGKNGPGFYITGKYDGTKVDVIQYPVTQVIGTADSNVGSTGTTTVSVYGGAAGSESDSTFNIAGCYLRFGFVPAGGEVTVGFINGQAYITSEHRTCIVKSDSGHSKGGSGTCSIYVNGSDTGVNITATALGAAVTAGKWATAWQEVNSGDWYVAPWECE